MTKIFLIIMVCFGLTLTASGIIIWSSVSNWEEVNTQSHVLATKTAEIRDRPTPITQPAEKDQQDPTPVDGEERTPGLRQLLREGKPNSLIYDGEIP